MNIFTLAVAFLSIATASLTAGTILDFSITEKTTEEQPDDLKEQNAKPITTTKTYKASYFLSPEQMLIKSNDKTIAIDFSEKTLYESNDGKSFKKTSVYATIDFRIRERKNRNHLANILNAAKLEKKKLLHIQSAVLMDHLLSTSLGAAPERQEKDGVITFSHDGLTLLQYTKKGTEWTERQCQLFTTALRYQYGIHPTILAELRTLKQCPHSIDLYIYNLRTTQYTFKLDLDFQNNSKEPHRVKADFSTLPLAVAVDAEEATVALKKLTKLKESGFDAALKSYSDRADKLIKEGNILDGFLLIMARNLASGAQPDAEEIALIKELIKEEDVLATLQALNPQNEEGAKIAVNIFTALLEKADEGKAVIHIFRGNTQDSLNQLEPATADLWTALSTDPMIVGVWHDLGKLYQKNYRSDIAWQCWEIARSLNPKHPFFDDIAQMEKQLKEENPDYFPAE